ncbi:NAD(P)-binding protein [Cyathus striatus]|nr:NAD(P)-binding protein [Cyathus striatus]
MGGIISFLSETFPPQSKFSVDDIGDLTGKVFLVTGGNTGVGFEIVKGLLQHNATVYLAARSASKGKEAIEQLKDVTGKEARFLQLDLSDLKSIKESAIEFNSKEKELHVLINNAGVMMPPLDQFTKDGYDLQFGTNVLGHFYFTKLLLPTLLATSTPSTPSRVVTVASAAGMMVNNINFDTLRDSSARNKLSKSTLYMQSKMANLVFATELARRYGDKGLVSASLNPGTLKSELARHVESAIEKLALKIISYPVPLGALSPLYAATAPDGASLNGKYFIPWVREGKLSKAVLDPQLGKDLWTWLEDQVAPLEA